MAKVWLAAHWGDKKLARPQIFATDISASVDTIVNPTMPLALRLSGHLLLGVVRIYSRKVKYVLSDCTEAMLKLQMAFASASGTNNPNAKGKELLDPSSTGAAVTGMGPHHTTIVDFGEYDQVHVVEDFCLPLPDQSEWILCEDEEEDEHGRGEQGEVVGHHARMSLPVPTAAASPMAKYQPPQEETWVPFDPDHEDEEDDDQQQQVGQQELSQVSDVEIVRAAGDSFLSNDETRRASSLLGKSQTLLDTSLPEQQRQNDNVEGEEDVDFANVPFEDDADEAAMAMDTTPDQQPPRDSSLLLHLSDDVSALETSATIGFGAGIEDSSMTGKRKSTMTNEGDKDNDNDETTDAPPQRIKRRKRRKVIIDNDATELSNEHIRDMLADTSDLISRQPHPADSVMREDYDEEDVDDANQNKDRSQRQEDKGFVVPSLTQPFLADSGYLHPSLTRLWKQNFYRALDLPCPFETIELHDDVEQVLQEQQPQDQQAMGDEGEENSDMERSSLMQAGSDDKKDDAGDENELEPPDDFVPPPMDEEGEEEEEDGPIVPNLDDDSEQEQVVPHRATGRSSSIGDLGLVNELELEDEDEDDIDDPEQREALGEHVGNKWHKHTVKVLKLLQSRLRTLDSDEDDDEEQEASKPTFLEFGELAKNVNRRTAASCFMECLQLKTWDFLELVQDEEYGPITITAGPRFHEAPPNEA